MSQQRGGLIANLVRGDVQQRGGLIESLMRGGMQQQSDFQQQGGMQQQQGGMQQQQGGFQQREQQGGARGDGYSAHRARALVAKEESTGIYSDEAVAKRTAWQQKLAEYRNENGGTLKNAMIALGKEKTYKTHPTTNRTGSPYRKRTKHRMTARSSKKGLRELYRSMGREDNGTRGYRSDLSKKSKVVRVPCGTKESKTYVNNAYNRSRGRVGKVYRDKRTRNLMDIRPECKDSWLYRHAMIRSDMRDVDNGQSWNGQRRLSKKRADAGIMRDSQEYRDYVQARDAAKAARAARRR